MPVASVTKTWGSEVLTSSDLNQNFTDLVNALNAVDNDNVSAGAGLDPDKIDDYSANASEMQTQVDPSGPTLSTTLTQELAKLRYAIAKLGGATYWYDVEVGFSTGDVKLTLKTAADTGWVLMNDGTIGNASSGADTASADTEDLFTLLWDNVVDVLSNTGTITGISVANPTVVTDVGHGLQTGDQITIAGSDSTPVIDGSRTVTVIDANTFTVPVNVTIIGTTGTWIRNIMMNGASVIAKGADAATDYAADRRLVLPLTLGRSLACADASGAGTAPNAIAHALGAVTGNDRNLPPHTHNISSANGGSSPYSPRVVGSDLAEQNKDVVTESTGVGGLDYLPPMVFLNVMIKL